MRTYQRLAVFLLGILISGSARAQVPLGDQDLSESAPANEWESYQKPQSFVPQSFADDRTRMERVVVDVGTIGLVREVPDSQVLALDENGVPLLNANSLQGSMQFGFKAMLDVRNVRPWFGGTDLQLGYFGINSLDAGATVNAQEVNSIFFQVFPLNPPTSFNFNYSSNLYSGEANLRFASNHRVRPITGLRYFKLEDTYDVFQQVGANGRSGFFSLTNNSMFGGQLGLEGDLWQTRRVNLYGFGKVAAMHNEVEGTATAQNGFRIYSDSSYTTLVDGGVGANIRFAGPLSFKVGYRSLFASDVALGIDQNAALSLANPNGAVQFNSQHWHGLDLAAVFEF